MVIRMSEYYERLKMAKSYDDIRILINDVISSAKYFKDNPKILGQLKQFMNLLLSMSSYLVGKKKDELIELGIADSQNRETEFAMLATLMDDISALDINLYKAIKLQLGVDEILDVPTMNRWIKDLIKLYKENGYDLKPRDFYGLFMSMDSNCYEKNNIVSSYMELFFRRQYDLESEEFIKFVMDKFKYSDVTMVTDKNPLYDMMNQASRILYGRHGNVFRRKIAKINEIFMGLGYGKIDVANLYDMRLLVAEELEKLDKALSDSEKGNYTGILEGYYYSPLVEDKMVGDIKVSKAIQLLSQDNFSNMSQNDRNGFMRNLPTIIDTVVKVSLFDQLKDVFKEYKDKCHISEILERQRVLSDRHFKLTAEYRDLVVDYMDVSDSKVSIINSKKKKEKNKNVLEECKKKKIEEIKEVEALISECSKKIEEFLTEFYSDYRVREKMVGINLRNIDDETRLFGMFEVVNNAPESKDISNNELFRRYNIILPPIGTEKFNDLAIICTDCLRSPQLVKRMEHGFSFESGVNQAYIERISKGEFDALIPEGNKTKK